MFQTVAWWPRCLTDAPRRTPARRRDLSHRDHTLTPECGARSSGRVPCAGVPWPFGPQAKRRVMIQSAAHRKPRHSFPVDEASLSHPGIKRAVALMHKRYAKRLDLEEVAAEACLSKYHFSRLFHCLVDMSFQDYLIQIRGEKAKQLLRQTPYLSLTRIAHRVGFGSLRNFEGQFKKLTGQSPSECRAGKTGKSARSFAKRARSRA